MAYSKGKLKAISFYTTIKQFCVLRVWFSLSLSLYAI